jgi:hypothetical protein
MADDPDEGAYYRARAEECFAEADALQDSRDVKLYRAFAKQFQQRARATEAASQRRGRREQP